LRSEPFAGKPRVKRVRLRGPDRPDKYKRQGKLEGKRLPNRSCNREPRRLLHRLARQPIRIRPLGFILSTS